jgi:hypothetical protein
MYMHNYTHMCNYKYPHRREYGTYALILKLLLCQEMVEEEILPTN